MYNESSRTYNYTELYRTDSSWIKFVYYDENARDAAIVMNDKVYLFTGVSNSAVEELVNADSVGGFKNSARFNELFGEGKNIGDGWRITVIRDAVKQPVVQNEWWDNRVQVSPQTTTESVKHRGAQVEDTTEVSLLTPVADKADVGNDYFVVFEVNGQTREHTVKGVDSLPEAVKALEEIAKMLGLVFDYTEVSKV